MKALLTIVSFFLTILIFQLNIFAQPCLPEGITFTTQEQIDNFQINYPGCTEVEGDIEITGDDITNLNGLINLTSVGGNLIISENESLTSLTGFQNITFIGENLIIQKNYVLPSLLGFNNINSIGGALWIGMNDNLNTLTGLENLNSIEDFFVIYCNNSLQSLIGLDNLLSVGFYFNIIDNPSLKNISSLNNLSFIGGDLAIFENDSLTSLSGLNNITASSINNLTIRENRSLSNCNTQAICNYLASPSGSVNIYNNASGCDNHVEVANVCGITITCLPYGNYYFTCQNDIEDFQIIYSGCNDLNGDVIINDADDDDINNLEGLSEVTSIEGALLINYNQDIKDLSGLNNVNIIGKYLSIKGNTFLESLVGLENLNSIGGGLYIESNPYLTNLLGLSNMTSIWGKIKIYNNHLLIGLSGLDNIYPNSIHSLEIHYNFSLDICDVESICGYLFNPYVNATIYNNAPGCNSKQEIKDQCDTVNVHEIIIASMITIYPNPSKDWLFIKQSNASCTYNIELRNLYGQLVKEVNNIQSQHYAINVDDLEAAVYFYVIRQENEIIQQGKLIIK